VRTDAIPTLSFRATRAGAVSLTGPLGSFGQELSAAVNHTTNLIVQPNQTRDHDHNQKTIEDAISRVSKCTGGDAHLSPLLAKIGIFVAVAGRLAQVWRASHNMHPEVLA